MGLKVLLSTSSLDNNNNNNRSLPNPDPSNYSIIRSKQINNFLVIEIQYHDCINYEGRKILLYRTDLNNLLKQKNIDPHFSDNKKYLSPIARFEPIEEGWENAIKLTNLIK